MPHLWKVPNPGGQVVALIHGQPCGVEPCRPRGWVRLTAGLTHCGTTGTSFSPLWEAGVGPQSQWPLQL